MSLWAEYKEEREGKFVLEDGDKAFAVFSYPSAEEVWIEDIYVRKDLRQTGLAKNLADQICALAAGQGCKYVLGSVWVSAKGSTDSMRVLLAYGMTLSHIEGNLIVFAKKIEGV